jgi:hypothetical protein
LASVLGKCGKGSLKLRNTRAASVPASVVLEADGRGLLAYLELLPHNVSGGRFVIVSFEESSVDTRTSSS